MFYSYLKQQYVEIYSLVTLLKYYSITSKSTGTPLRTCAYCTVLAFMFVCQGFHWPVRAQKALFATTMQMKSLEMN